ncbi:MAG: hypothetical protein LBG30_01950 [Odoribacteraceae bacterium]|nr:hypothetical protein [Odoribacteraceae bacterium]
MSTRMYVVAGMLACGALLDSCRGGAAGETVTYEELPRPARRFIERHFPGEAVKGVRRGKDGDEVRLEGHRLAFSAYGSWRSVSAGEGMEAPATVLALAPPRVCRQVYDHEEGEIRRLAKRAGGFEARVSSAEGTLVFGMDGELMVDGGGWRRAVALSPEARLFLARYFPGELVVASTACCETREVVLEGGASVSFSSGWEWTVVRGGGRGLSSRAMSLLPEASVFFLQSRLPDGEVMEIAREANAYAARVESSRASGEVVFDLSGEWRNAYSGGVSYRFSEEASVSSLPAAALAFALEHLGEGGAAYAEGHAGGYMVMGRDGTRMDFTREGALRRVETSAREGLPPGMIPVALGERARECFPGRRLVAYYPQGSDSPGGARVVVAGHSPSVVHEFSRAGEFTASWP